MSCPHSKPMSIGNSFILSGGAFNAGDGALPFVQSTDRAIDAALKSVPLPEGMMTRLGLIVSAMPDELSDRVDYLGC